MVKVNTIPKGTHSQGWMGPDDLHDYTIQADFRATTNNQAAPENGMSDIGLIAQRYTLMLMGADQQLRILYWPRPGIDELPQDRAVRLEAGPLVHHEIPGRNAG